MTSGLTAILFRNMTLPLELRQIELYHTHMYSSTLILTMGRKDHYFLYLDEATQAQRNQGHTTNI